ncbi:hypothetical protein FA950_29325 [Bacillus thuringiensis]|uniref:hypothetical protein n=1 Tax=Bacillus thuringiensis TaxID=1428 RepID=UPI0010AC7A02|nr:hypothetical protein [Bacillus thuringiensis]TJZ99978.1 hypothetical protein FA950_29325 [Bacillus thuringiensis]
MRFIKMWNNSIFIGVLVFCSSPLLTIQAEEQKLIGSHKRQNIYINDIQSFIEIRSIDANTQIGIPGNEFTIFSYGNPVIQGTTDENGVLTLPIQYGIPQVCMQTTWKSYYQPVHEGFYFLPWEPVQYTAKNYPI